jgi:hypothetical protein
MGHKNHAVPRSRVYWPVAAPCDQRTPGWCWRCATCHPVSRFAGLEGGTQRVLQPGLSAGAAMREARLLARARLMDMAHVGESAEERRVRIGGARPRVVCKVTK